MEASIGTPIEYIREDDKTQVQQQEIDHREEFLYSQQQQQQEQLYQQQQMLEMLMQQQQQPNKVQQLAPLLPIKTDLLSGLDKIAYLMAFLAFIIGFFMGKSLQPLIIRPS